MTVSIETAVRLNAAGFIQPNFYLGHLLEVPNSREWAFVGTAQFEYLKNGRREEIVFRPTATDIMREMEDSTLYYNGRTNKYSVSGAAVNTSWCTEIHGNPAEAAAMAWLSIHEKTESE